MEQPTEVKLSSSVEFQRRRMTFAKRGLLPMLILVLTGITLLTLALQSHNEMFALFGNIIIFISGFVFVLSAKRYYRCPVCEKVVVPTRDDGTPSDISFAIAYNPLACPYCATVLK